MSMFELLESSWSNDGRRKYVYCPIDKQMTVRIHPNASVRYGVENKEKAMEIMNQYYPGSELIHK